MAKKDRGKGNSPTWVRFSGIGVEFAGAVVGFTLIGYYIDRHYGSQPWGVIIGATLGLVGGMYNLIRESLTASRDAAEEDKESAKANHGHRHEP